MILLSFMANFSRIIMLQHNRQLNIEMIISCKIEKNVPGVTSVVKVTTGNSDISQ